MDKITMKSLEWLDGKVSECTDEMDDCEMSMVDQGCLLLINRFCPKDPQFMGLISLTTMAYANAKCLKKMDEFADALGPLLEFFRKSQKEIKPGIKKKVGELIEFLKSGDGHV